MTIRPFALKTTLILVLFAVLLAVGWGALYVMHMVRYTEHEIGILSDPPAPPTQTWAQAEHKNVALEAKMGALNARDGRKFFDIEHASNTHGKISDANLAWVIKFMQREKGRPEQWTDRLRQQRVMIAMTSLKNYSPHQRNMYLPALLSYTKSSDGYVREAALYGLWALKDMRAAPTIAKMISDPILGLTDRQRTKFSGFAKHCKADA